MSEDRGSADPRRRKPRDRPLVVVVTGDGKGKSTSAFGMLLRSWARGYRCGVFQFVKSGKWKVGEAKAAAALGGIDWEKMGDGWTWISRDLEDVLATLRDRPGFQHVLLTGRRAPEALIEAADLVSEVVKVKHPMDAGIRAQQGIEW